MNKIIKKLITVAGAALIATATLTACSAPVDTHMTSGEHGHSMSAEDVMFAQMMIPHHQQALVMSDLAATNGESEALKALAARIKAEQQPEIDLMKSWLEEAGETLEMGHAMHMDGMLSDEQIDELSKATGAAFDELFIKGMIAHHEGAIRMAEAVKDSSNHEVEELAQEIIKTQTAEIAELEALLKN